MSPLVILEPPRPRLTPNVPGWRPFFSMGFRPLYLLAAIYGACAILAWVLGGVGGGRLGGFYWHAHEMIWGFTGAIIVGFLLTAVANWTGEPPIQGAVLAGLVGLWLGARILATASLGSPVLVCLVSQAFYLAAAIAVAKPILRTKNRRNVGVPVLLVTFGLTEVGFFLAISGTVPVDPRRFLHVGLTMVATIIFFVGLRVIPFFTHRALGVPQVGHGRWVLGPALGGPLILGACIAGGVDGLVPVIAGLVGMGVNVHRLMSWWRPQAVRLPLLWILYVGYGFTALGLGAVGLAVGYLPWLLSAAVHGVAVGGIGILTLGMMTRTALGHTGRRLELPRPMVTAYWLMISAAGLRLVAVPASGLAHYSLVASGLCFSLALALFVWRYGPWLVRTREDGLP